MPARRGNAPVVDDRDGRIGDVGVAHRGAHRAIDARREVGDIARRMERLVAGVDEHNHHDRGEGRGRDDGKNDSPGDGQSPPHAMSHRNQSRGLRPEGSFFAQVR